MIAENNPAIMPPAPSSRLASRGRLLARQTAKICRPFLLRCLFLILLAAMAAGCPPMATAATRLSYKGLNPGISTLSDAQRILGKPVAKIHASDHTIFKYTHVTVISQKRSEKISSITVDDPGYRDANGVAVGSNQNLITSYLGLTPSGGTIVDKQNGIVYILDGRGAVAQIMYRETGN